MARLFQVLIQTGSNVSMSIFSAEKINYDRLHVRNWLRVYTYVVFAHEYTDRTKFIKFLLIEGEGIS
jgi:hypothetical protein